MLELVDKTVLKTVDHCDRGDATSPTATKRKR